MVVGESLSSGAGSPSVFQQPFRLNPDPTQPLLISPVAFQLASAIVAAQTWDSIGVQVDAIAALVKPPITDAALAIATLPLALFYHDDLSRQRQAMEQAMAAWQLNDESQGWLILFAYAISQAIKGHLDPPIFIDQSQAYLRVAGSYESPVLETLLGQLDEIKSLHRSLAQTAQLSHPIAIAIACFLSTPENLPLALHRASQLARPQSSITTLTGALSGAYNGAVSIPAAWIMPWMHSATGIPSVQELQTLTLQLLATWAGAYTPSNFPQMPPPDVAAPWAMRVS